LEVEGCGGKWRVVEGCFSISLDKITQHIGSTPSIPSIPSTLSKDKNITLLEGGKKMMETVGMVLDRIEAQQAMSLQLRPDGTSLDLLRAIYRNPSLALPVRMRAAIAALPFEAPKLSVIAQVSETDFAAILDRRLQNMERLNNGKAIEVKPVPQVETRPSMPRVADRRFRRI
jgi:hypothetical protein